MLYCSSFGARQWLSLLSSNIDQPSLKKVMNFFIMTVIISTSWSMGFVCLADEHLILITTCFAWGLWQSAFLTPTCGCSSFSGANRQVVSVVVSIIKCWSKDLDFEKEATFSTPGIHTHPAWKYIRALVLLCSLAWATLLLKHRTTSLALSDYNFELK